MGINVGDLRYTIKLKVLNSVKGDYGSVKETYVESISLRAGKKHISGNKTINLDEVFSSQILQFTTHYRENIDEKMRIEFSGKEYKILSIVEIGYKEGLLLTCELINQ